MTYYVAFLRGINIGGKNIIAMKALKEAFETSGFCDVQTYINSGNVIFRTEETDEIHLIGKIEALIQVSFSLTIPVTIRSYENLIRIVQEAPEWWGTKDKSTYHNALFVIEPLTPQDVQDILGPHKEAIETMVIGDGLIYWSCDLASFNKTVGSKLASSKANHGVTVRTANTVKKIIALVERADQKR